MTTTLLATHATSSEWQFVPNPELAFPKTRTTQDRLIEMSTFRAILPDLANKAATAHQNALDAVLAHHTAENSIRNSVELLQELSDRGFAWSGIARLLRVSVPALRKWRIGESEPTAPNRRSIAGLVAFSRILEDQCHVGDVASWLEMPLVDGFNIDAFELLLAERRDLVYEVAAGRMEPSAALDDFLPNWRQTLAPKLEILMADDGMVAVRPKN
jgi:DNA-binding transcriptional regulator YiaG